MTGNQPLTTGPDVMGPQQRRLFDCLDVRHYQALCDVSQIDKYEAGNTVSTASLQQPPTDQADLAAGQTCLSQRHSLNCR